MKNNSKRIRNFRIYLTVGFLLAAVFLGLFAYIAAEVAGREIMNLDDRVYQSFAVLRGSPIDRGMIWTTHLGSAGTLIFIALVLFYFLRRIEGHYWDSLIAALNLSGAWGLNELLKSLFHRARPSVEHLTKATGYSFPSGHAMISFAFYGYVAYILYINIRNPYLRVITACFFVLLPIAIGISRIYLGVHYASDVLAGLSAGLVWLIFCIMGDRTVRYYKSDES